MITHVVHLLFTNTDDITDDSSYSKWWDKGSRVAQEAAQERKEHLPAIGTGVDTEHAQGGFLSFGPLLSKEEMYKYTHTHGKTISGLVLQLSKSSAIAQVHGKRLIPTIWST